METLVENRRL